MHDDELVMYLARMVAVCIIGVGLLCIAVKLIDGPQHRLGYIVIDKNNNISYKRTLEGL